MTALATIGTQGASIAALIAALKAAGVTVVLDVRAVPWSRRPEFAKRALSETLSEAGIAYVHLPGLGNPKAGRDAARAGRRDDYRRIFTAHLDTPAAQTDLDRAAALASAGKACLLCMEREPQHCHRSLVADALAERLPLLVENLEAVPGSLTLPLP